MGVLVYSDAAGADCISTFRDVRHEGASNIVEVLMRRL